MGNSASINPPNNQHEVDADNVSLENVQNFTKLAYDVSPKDEVLKVIMTNNEARKAFLDFLKSEKSINFQHFFELTRGLKNNDCVVYSSNNDEITSDLLIQSYILPEDENTEVEVESMSENIRSLLNGERDYSNREILEMLDGSRRHSLILLALESLPIFVTSHHFDRWRDVETLRSLDVASMNSERNVTIPEILAEELPGENLISAEVAFVRSHHQYACIIEGKKSTDILGESTIAFAVNVEDTEKEDYVEEALKHVDYLEINRILHSGSWLFAFIAAVENLPICVTLSTASSDRFGFPLIYVNKYFEATTGYARDDIMGANCKFLQRNPAGLIRSEMDSVQRLSTALRNAEPVKAAITNFRRNGTAFKNLLAMKPVFDLKGKYQFVIGLQFNISSSRSSTLSLRMVDSLMNLLPSTVVF